MIERWAEIEDEDDLRDSSFAAEALPWCGICGELWLIQPMCAGHVHRDAIAFVSVLEMVRAALAVEVFFGLAARERCPECREFPRCLQAPCYYDLRFC